MRTRLPELAPVEADWRHPNYKDCVRDKHTFIESLPFPRVTYPCVYGTWLFFQENADSQPFFCSCQKPAIINFLRMNEIKGAYHLCKGDSLLRHFIPKGFVTDVPHVSTTDEFLALDIFRPNICHRCLLRVPPVRWSNHPDHSVFLHHFGWYWKHQMLAYGIDWFMPFLRDQCPSDLASFLLIDPWEAQARIFAYERQHHLYIHLFRHLGDTPNSCPPDMASMLELAESMQSVRRAIEHEVERRLRVHFGFPARGKTLNNETVLFLICKAIFPAYTVERHARPSVLQGLTLDIYVPELRIAMEYQGSQHFEPAYHLGGEKQFRMTLRRDRRKVKLCLENGISLVLFDVSDKLTEEYVREKLIRQAPSLQLTINS